MGGTTVATIPRYINVCRSIGAPALHIQAGRSGTATFGAAAAHLENNPNKKAPDIYRDHCTEVMLSLPRPVRPPRAADLRRGARPCSTSRRPGTKPGSPLP